MRILLNFYINTLAIAVLLLIGSATYAAAATFTVTNTNDSGAGSLRDAVTQAGANNAEDTINFDSTVFNTARTITLTTGEIVINSDGGNTINSGRKLTINGPGANLLTISGGNASRMFFVSTGSFVAMRGMTLRNGNGVGTVLNTEGVSGGAIIATAGVDLTLANMVIRNNSVPGIGGAMFLNSPKNFTMIDSLVTENFAVVYGGGIYSSFGNANTIRNTTISNNSTDNQVGGLAIERGITTIENCQIIGNRAGLAEGGTNAIGGLALFLTTATVTDTSISNNMSGVSTVNGGSIGGVSADGGNMTFRRVTVSGNTAYGNTGGMHLRGGGSTINVIDSTISNNQTINPQFLSFTLGGGMRVLGTTNLINSTLANNKAGSGYGGGVAVEGGVRFNVINATISSNIAEASNPNNNADGGGGIFDVTLLSGATTPEIRVQNSIIALNTGPGGPDVTGTFISNGYNIIGNTANSTGFGAAGDRLNVNPLLSPNGLQNNGGATQTIALQTGSPAINAGNNAFAADQNGNLLPFDQRGRCFERFVGGTVDIGAYETGANAACNPSRFDFDGDGRDDVSVFRPSNGVWYLNQSTNGFTGVAFGQNGDMITPADYDGDGRTDIAVFRPSNGVWYLQRSTQGFTGIPFGASGDIPMPGDFDGDGRADLAVFRPSNGVWYIQGTTAGFYGILFGANGDKPVAGDYDGDGRTDIAVFRPSNGVWYLQRSQAGFIGFLFGESTDKPSPADYDGDGKTDLAVFRPSNGVWYLQQSQAGFTGVAFGASGDLPAAADYDGDGRADIAVFRPSNGVWYLNRSTQGFTGVAFGASGDKPAPNAYVP